MKKINGYIAAPFTPMHTNGDVNLELIPEYAQFVINNGLDGVFICGSSGEGALLTLEERMAIAEKWIETGGKDLKIVVHTGGTNLRDQKKLGKHSAEIGAWAIASMAPAFLSPKRTEELVEYCKEIAYSAPELPFYYYHIPPLNNVNLSVQDFLKASEHVIPNLAGVKFTDMNIYEFDQCKYIANGKYEMLWGLDEMFLDGLAFGHKAGIGGTYNHCFGLYKDMKNAFEENDMATCQRLQHKSHQFCNILGKYRGNIVAGKRMMKFLGLDCGPNRLPLQTISDQEEKEIEEALIKIDFFNFCNK